MSKVTLTIRPWRLAYGIAVTLLAFVWVGWPGVVVAALMACDMERS